jgi:cephalosporin-C deacetylase
MKALKHPYPIDPPYGYSLEDLLAVGAPEAPVDHEAFWQTRYEKALAIDPGLVMVAKGTVKARWRVHEIVYQSTGGAKIGGWCLTPVKGAVERVMLVLHGYGGREGPD